MRYWVVFTIMFIWLCNLKTICIIRVSVNLLYLMCINIYCSSAHDVGFGILNDWSSLSLSNINMEPSSNDAINKSSDPGIHFTIVAFELFMIPYTSSIRILLFPPITTRLTFLFKRLYRLHNISYQRKSPEENPIMTSKCSVLLVTELISWHVI